MSCGDANGGREVRRASGGVNKARRESRQPGGGRIALAVVGFGGWQHAALQESSRAEKVAAESFNINRGRVSNYRDGGGGEAELVRLRRKIQKRESDNSWGNGGGIREGGSCFALPLLEPCRPLIRRELVGGWEPPQRRRKVAPIT